MLCLQAASLRVAGRAAPNVLKACELCVLRASGLHEVALEASGLHALIATGLLDLEASGLHVLIAAGLHEMVLEA